MAPSPKPIAPGPDGQEHFDTIRERANKLAREEGRPEPFPEPKQDGGTNWTALAAELRRDFKYTVIP
jgi:hypothetical protein